jgi:hypothetical protein
MENDSSGYGSHVQQLTTVEIHFHYAQGLRGLLVKTAQRLMGLRYAHFTHVSLHVGTDLYEMNYDACSVAAQLPTQIPPRLTLWLHLPLTASELLANAYATLHDNGEFSLLVGNTCATFVCDVIGWARAFTPAELYEVVYDEFADRLRDTCDRERKRYDNSVYFAASKRACNAGTDRYDL